MHYADPNGTHTHRYPAVSNRKPLIINANKEKLMKPTTVIQFTLLLVTCFLSAFYVQALDVSDEFKILADDGASGDNFGNSVSISGETAIVGASQDGDKGDNSGSAYIFVRNGLTWAEQAKLIASDGAPGDRFGGSVSISGDTAIVGAYGDGDKGEDSGSAYIFVRNGSTWTQQVKLTASDGAYNDNFGKAVSILGETAIVGAPGAQSSKGAAYVFVREGGSWTQQAKLTASDGAMYNYLGYSVSISGDTAIVGARGDDDNGDSSGSAYIFVRNGVTWTEQAKLIASDGAENDNFGNSVLISGETAIVGAALDDDKGDLSGSAYIFGLDSDTSSEVGADSLPNQIVWLKDGAEMAYIPAGSFEMGDHLDDANMSNALPVHTVTLNGFYMDKTEVTVGQFKDFLADTDYSWGGSWDEVDQYSPSDDHPMIYVNYDDVVAYADWVGKRLPTGAEWEYAARGGLIGQRYPWGDEIDNSKANYWNDGDDSGTTVAGSYSANGYGLHDMAGNVSEWCADWYDAAYYDSSAETNPLGPDSGQWRVLRGGSWSDSTTGLPVAVRFKADPSIRHLPFGFRCVSGSLTPGSFTILLPATGQTGANWFADLSLNATDYTWTTVDASSASLTVSLFVQPLGGIDASGWDFSAISTVNALADQLGSGDLNLTEGTDYQLLVVGQDDQGTTDDTSDDVIETLSVQLTGLSSPIDQPLPQWFANISLDPTDYTWSQLQADSPNLTLRLLVRPLEGTDVTGWDFRAITTLTALSNLLGAGVLNLQQGSHYQLQLLAQDDQGTAGDTSDDVSETLSLQWSDLMPPQLLLASSQVNFGSVRVANLTLTDVHGQQWQLSTPANSRSLSLHNAGGGQLSITQIEKSSPLDTILSITAADDSVLVYPLQIAAGSSRQVKLVLSPSSPSTALSAQLTLHSNDSANPSQTVTVKIDSVADFESESNSQATFSLQLAVGLNMISLPNQPETAYTAETLSAYVQDVSLLIRLQAISQEFQAYIPSLDVGQSGFTIDGGQGYIVNLLEAKSVDFTGQAWSNLAGAPPVVKQLSNLQAGSNQGWAFVLQGQLPNQLEGVEGLELRLSDKQTGQVLTRQAVTTPDFRLALVNQSRQAVVHQGQQLQLDVFNRKRHRVGTQQLELQAEALAQAYVQIEVDYRHIPTFSRLLQNYPNPFNPETWIPFELNQDSDVSLTIYDTAGRLVRRLDIGFQEAGTYLQRDRAIYWDGRTQSGEQVASGTYFYTLKTEGYTSTQKMIILK